jgi:hypothetical protein
MKEQFYTKGFNHGYIMAKYLPNLLVKVLNGLSPTSDYLSGFFSGKEEYELEYSQKQLDQLRSLRDNANNQERDLGE